MKTMSFFILAASLFMHRFSLAQDSRPALGWAEIVDKTRQTNPDLKASESTLRSLEYAEKAASNGYFPQITASLGYTRGNSSSSLLETANDTTNSYTASITATQNLFSGFLDQAKSEQARANAKASQAALNIAKAKTSFELKSAYAFLLFAQNNMALAQDIMLRREANLKLVSLRFDSGNENKGSVLLSKANLEQSKFEVLQSQNAIHSSQIQMAKVLGIDAPTAIKLKGDLVLPDDNSPPDLRNLAEQTPEVLQSRFQEQSARAALKVTDANFYPSLNLTGTTANSGPDYPSTNRWSVGATLSFPLFSGGRDYYGHKSSTESWRAANYSSESQKEQTLLKLQQAYSTFVETNLKLSVDEAFAQALTVQERIAKQKYNNGLLIFEDWDKIENDLISRQKVVLQTQRDRIVNEAAWEQAQGKGVFP